MPSKTFSLNVSIVPTLPGPPKNLYVSAKYTARIANAKSKLSRLQFLVATRLVASHLELERMKRGKATDHDQLAEFSTALVKF